MEFKDIKSSVELKNHLNSPLSNTRIKFFYHYTTIESLYKIFKNKTLHFSKMSAMNDLLEEEFASGCDDYFFCLSCGYEAEYENFGMWSMYGNLGKNIENDFEKGVKIQFPKDAIENLRNESNRNVKFHSVAYKNFIFDAENAIISLGKGDNKQISFDIEVLKGYIKDSAWQYEKEARLRIESEKNDKPSYHDLPVSENVLKKLVVYPSPDLSLDKAKKIFENLCKDQGYPSVIPCFKQNRYKESYQSKQKKGESK